MTKEQVHDLMENELKCVQRGAYCDRDCAKCPLVKDDKELIGAYRYVIKSLEQEPLLDKIRVEIEALNPVDYVSMSSYEGHRGAGDMKEDVLQIIDKAKAESENEK